MRSRRRLSRTLCSLASLAVAAMLSSPAAAQLPSTHLNSLYPPGTKQGATVEVTATGANVGEADRLVFSHDGITATAKTAPPNEFVSDPAPVPGVFQVQVAADVPPGLYEARLAGALGVSNPRLFVVGSRDELLDDGANRSRDKAQELPIGSTVNGKVEANQFDHYKLTLKTGQRVLVLCQASRIDSQLDPVLTVSGPDGRQLAQSHDYLGRDGFLDFTAPADGEYLVAVRDFLYGGSADHFYRLTAHSDAHIDYVLPPAAVAGASSEVTVYGRNLPGGQPSDVVGADGVKLEQLAVSVAAPGEALPPGGVDAPLQSSLLRRFVHRHEGLSILLSAAAVDRVVTESADNDAPEGATELTVPAEAGGNFYPARDTDWYQFQAAKGDVLWIEVISQRLGLDTDPSLLVQRVDVDDKGEETVKEVAFVDDPSDRAARVATDFDTSTDDPSYRLAVPEDGTYRVRVDDNFGDSRSDPRNVYRLIVRPETPDFRVTAFVRELKVANANQVPVFAPRMHQGGTCPIEIRIDRLDGFDGEVRVTAEGLPEGVECHDVIVSPGQETATLVFQCKEDAAPWSGPVGLVAEAAIGEQPVKRQVAVGTVVWGTANRTQISPTFRLAQDFMLSVSAEPAPATVIVGDGQVLETSVGGKLELPVKVARRAGHVDPLKLTAIDAPKEFKPGDITVNKDQADGKLVVDVKNGSKPGVYTFFLRSDSKVKYAANTRDVTRHEQLQKQLDEVVKALAEETKQMTEAAAKAKQEATAMAAETKQADAAKQAAEAKKAEAEKAAQAAAQAQAQAEQAAAEKGDDEALAAAAKAKAEEAAKAAAALEEAVAALAEATKAAEQAAADSQAAAQAQADAEAKLKELQDRSKRAADAKKKADTDLANAKKAAAPKDVNFAVYSTPVRIRVVAAPFDVSLPEQAELKPGEKVTVPVKLDKKFGFDEAVDVTVALPKGVGGVTPAKLQIAKGAAEGTLELTANDKPTAGDHELTVTVKGKFNNVDVTSEEKLTLKVAEPPAE